ncbi:Sec23-binding domain of Sec16-domain-containing protein [Crepidotus variabilis]|uniref:Protein transport protein sec16 n=1 Tax=Crepidotus variabilis TaxID=179855 RepID=A0A9P6EPP9_9AGAR|nr:Sec23-binding domain of Sec16-domain-containing protein [Crepidotus variabilis]
MHHSLAPIRPTVSQYAPSPSLLGANDPLARTSARAPVITFGFGGKMVTCFHGMPGLNTGFDVALSARTTSELKVRVLQKILPESALNTPGAVYPGPLVSDPDTSALSLIKSGANAQSKNKKTSLLAYLTARADEINQGLGYLTPDQRKRSESKMVLLKLLKVLVEHDGRLLGVSQAEAAVRQALVPYLDGETALQDDSLSLLAAYQTGPSDEAPLNVTSLRPSMLSKIEDFLLQGDRRQAYHYAMDQKLWAHAMIISSSLDREAWKGVVNEFLRSELASKDSQPRGLPAVTDVKSYESLRMAYSLFSGQGAASVQELAPPASLQQMAGTGLLQPPATPSLSAMTPRTPNFPAIQPPLNIPTESLAKWAETVAMIISSPLTAETSAALTALGDQLAARGWIDAAHACFLLSPQTSAVAGHGTPGARITLVGTKNPANAFKDPDCVIFSEILEFTMSLVPTTKGQESFHGLPHLQAYRFIRATWLAEIGDMQTANRYCDAIAASLGQNSPYTTPALLEQLTGLKQRLTGVFHGDKSGSWIGNKLTKPSLDSIGGWLEGRFTKLVTGDTDSPDPADNQPKAPDSAFGPFAHYSTISSTTPSERSSPQPESYVPAFATAGHPRSSSEISGSSPYAPPPPERSSSAMGYSRAKPPMPSNTSSTYSIPSSKSSPSGYNFSGPPLNVSDPNNGSWWGSDESNQDTVTPTASTFMHTAEGSVDSGSEGFISLMDNQSFAFESGPSSRQSSTPALQEVDDEEDLGFGNSKPKPKLEQKEGSGSPTATVPAAEAPKAPPPATEMPAEKPASGGSWFGRLWGRSESTGPVKASLGEQSAFYYDKDLKRWVNKKAGAEEAKPAPTPPPPRSQTASPGMAMSGRSMPPLVGSGPPPPPQRPTSAIDLTTEPPTKVPPRIRSNLAPPGADSLPGTPTTPGPPSRPRSQASRKSVRSRYVDVFSQETGGNASS